MDENDLPFKVGQLAEARSFARGYRGAWFRCKIIDIARRDSGMLYALQYYDFPDEKLKWTKLYQYPKPRLKNSERQLMVRPCFPSVYRENKLSEIKTISEVVVVVNDVWKVGDFVDWWTDGCYWSGRLTKALGNEKYLIDLFPPPAGEGSSYEASSKDFRPSLSWSLDSGWIVPIPSVIDNHRPCARLIKPVNQGSSTNLAIQAADKGRKDPEATVRASNELNALFSSHIATSRSKLMGKGPFSSHIATSRSELMGKGPLNPAASNETRTPGRNTGFDETNGGANKSSCSDSQSSPHVRGASAEVAEAAADKGRKDPEATVRASSELNASFSSHITTSRYKLMGKGPFSSHIATSRSELMGKGPMNPAASNETRTPGRNTGLDETNGGATKSSFSDSQSSPHVRGASAEVAEAAADKGRKDPEATVRASSELNASFSSHIATSRSKLMGKGPFSSHIATSRFELMGKGPMNPAASNETRTPGRNTGLDETNGGATKSSCSDSQSSPHVRGASAEVAEAAADKGRKDPEATVRASSELNASISSHIATSRSKLMGKGLFSSHIATSRSELMGKGPLNTAASNETRTTGRNTGLDETNGGATKSSFSDSQSSPHVIGASAAVAEAAADKGRKDPEATVRALSKLNASFSSHIATSRSELMGKGPMNSAASNETRTPGRNTGLDETNGGATKSSFSDSQSSPHVRGASAEVAEAAADKGRKDPEATVGASSKLNASFSSHIATSRSKLMGKGPFSSHIAASRSELMGKGPWNPAASNETRTPGRNTGLNETNGGATKSSFSDSQSSPHVKGASAEVAEAAADKGRKDPEATVRASSELNALFSSHIATSRSELVGKEPLNPAASKETRTPGRNTGLDERNGGATKSSCSDSQSSPHVRGASAEVAEDTGGKDSDNNDPPLKKMKTDGGICLDSTCSDTIEAAILDLEVLVNRIKWMKDALKFGMPLSNTATPSWKFLEHRGPSRPK